MDWSWAGPPLDVRPLFPVEGAVFVGDPARPGHPRPRLGCQLAPSAEAWLRCPDLGWVVERSVPG